MAPRVCIRAANERFQFTTLSTFQITRYNAHSSHLCLTRDTVHEYVAAGVIVRRFISVVFISSVSPAQAYALVIIQNLYVTLWLHHLFA